jgi:hypothetical protein
MNTIHHLCPFNITRVRSRRSGSSTEQNMNGTAFRFAIAWLFLFASLALPNGLAAQDPPPPAETPQEGVVQGNYVVKQTMEIGGRLTDVEGNRSIHRTFANYNEGFNLFEYSLDMRSLNHTGLFWDNLSLNSFGFGSDPNSVARLRVYKNKWYNFGLTFRRDKNYWDYNLLANPLNPTTAITNAPTGFDPVLNVSPHATELVRRMYDTNLTLLPQSPIRVRLGYSRNISEGPSLTSFHEGTDVFFFQPWKTTLNSYQLGVDFKVLPRTNISFDQFWHFYKGDTSWMDIVQANALPTGVIDPAWLSELQTFSMPTGVLADGTPFTTVDLGLIWNTVASQPCASPFVAGGTANPTCNGYQQYNRDSRIRASYPSSRISLQSNYFRNLDFSASLAYTSTDANTDFYNEFFNGLPTRTRQRQFNVFGLQPFSVAITDPLSGDTLQFDVRKPVEVRRVATSADFGITWQITNKLAVQNSFNFLNFRIPGQSVLAECSFFGTTMAAPATVFGAVGPSPVLSPVVCPTLAGATVGTPSHASSSPADVIVAGASNFLGEDAKTNTFMVRYDLNRHFGGRVGYRYRNRDIVIRLMDAEELWFFPSLPNRGACAGQPLRADGSCYVQVLSTNTSPTHPHGEQTVVNEHSAILGLWARAGSLFRASFDMELLSADQSFTRISPRQMQRYKLRVNYSPVDWASFAGTVNIQEARNNVVEILHKRHNRVYGFSTTLMPNERFGLDIGYDFNDIYSESNICYTIGAVPPGSTPCPTAASLLSGISMYEDDAHFFYFDWMWRPFRRLETRLGYSVTSSDGRTTFLNPNAPPGPLTVTYYLPTASVGFDITKNLTWKAGWNYYKYDEGGLLEPTGPRQFKANLINLSLRYAF